MHMVKICRKILKYYYFLLRNLYLFNSKKKQIWGFFFQFNFKHLKKYRCLYEKTLKFKQTSLCIN